MIVTIDGPTASGKSTVARELAKRLGITYINSGLLFRALAYLAETKHLTLNSESLNHILTLGKESILRYCYTQEQGAQVFYQDEDITPLLKTPSMDQLASKIALDPQVREVIALYQQKLAQTHSVIAEGRDCGTVIFPQADYKFYITASLDVRAQRWQKDQEKKGAHYTLKESKHFVEERDTRDSERSLAPLAIPVGAQVIDTSTMTIGQVIDTCLAFIKQMNDTELD